MTLKKNKYDGLEIAVIGLACKFPKSDSPRAFWDNLKNGKELLTTFSNEELINLGIKEEVLKEGSYAKSEGVLDFKDQFDQGFFGYSIDEANLMDPQIRLFHELCWEGLEDSGYASQTEKKKIGLYAAATSNENWKIHAYRQGNKTSVSPFFSTIITKQNFVSSLVSHKLNLTGPVQYIDTACSSSLVAIHQACRSLLTRECNIALAGGVSIKTIKQKGYQYQEGMVRSKDGHCRTFDSKATGTATGEGAGIVVLKRLSEAIADKDHIYAIVKGSAINNDGNRKVGFTAPSVKGQSDCIKSAMKFGNVTPESISYVEAHGTATKLGDPIEVRALSEAFGGDGSEKFCALGCVKTNMGHLDAAAGVAGFIKTVLSLYNKQIPAHLNFTSPNPEIDFEKSPFYVNTSLRKWEPKNDDPLRAGVSSFGIGGTNAHVILEEAPVNPEINTQSNYKLLTLSAKTENAVRRYASDLSSFIKEHPETNDANMSHTLQTGRKHFSYRKAIIYQNKEELLTLLNSTIEQKKFVKAQKKESNLVFMFPGQGSQYVNMGKDLYLELPEFKKYMDQGFQVLKDLTGHNFKEILFSNSEPEKSVIYETVYAQPLVFLFQYSLSKQLNCYGIKPKYMIGHSLGEYVAACINGVFTFEEALLLVVKRGELMNSLQKGDMLSVSMKESDAIPYLNENISLAAVNGPQQIVFSGDKESIENLMTDLEKENIMYVKLKTSHAFHSSMQDSILELFREVLNKIKLQEVETSFVSNRTGKIILKEEASSSEYWVKHIRETVKFSEGIKTLLSKESDLVFIEVGSGHTLSNLLKQIRTDQDKTVVLNLVRSFNENINDQEKLHKCLGELWANGVSVDWNNYHNGEDRYMIPLPTYSFEPNKYTTEVDPFGEMSLVQQDLNLENKPVEPVFEEKKSERPELENNYCAPVTETEKELVQIFEDLLGIKKIGIEDSFFELGGDSLKAMMLINKISSKFKFNMGLKEFLKFESIKGLAEEVDRKLWISEHLSLNNSNESSENVSDLINNDIDQFSI